MIKCRFSKTVKATSLMANCKTGLRMCSGVQRFNTVAAFSKLRMRRHCRLP